MDLKQQAYKNLPPLHGHHIVFTWTRNFHESNCNMPWSLRNNTGWDPIFFAHAIIGLYLPGLKKIWIWSCGMSQKLPQPRGITHKLI